MSHVLTVPLSHCSTHTHLNKSEQSLQQHHISFFVWVQRSLTAMTGAALLYWLSTHSPQGPLLYLCTLAEEISVGEEQQLSTSTMRGKGHIMLMHVHTYIHTATIMVASGCATTERCMLAKCGHAKLIVLSQKRHFCRECQCTCMNSTSYTYLITGPFCP